MGRAAEKSQVVEMAVQSLRSLVRAALLVLTVALVGCSGASTASQPPAIPLQIVSAKVDVNPSKYAGACGAKQDLSFTATLSANANNLGGAVHYVWIINHAKTEGDVTLGPGDTTKTVTQSLSYVIPVDSGPELVASFATTTPNAVAAPDAMFTIACTVPFQVTDVSVIMQPWSASCGAQTFGWSATITAPFNNVGGTVHYTWRFSVGASRSGTVTFPPGQITEVLTTSQTYYIVHSDGDPTPPGTTYPAVTGSEILGRLYIDSPNSITDFAVPEHVNC
jgi:hypothetical protein